MQKIISNHGGERNDSTRLSRNDSNGTKEKHAPALLSVERLQNIVSKVFSFVAKKLPRYPASLADAGKVD